MPPKPSWLLKPPSPDRVVQNPPDPRRVSLPPNPYIVSAGQHALPVASLIATPWTGYSMAHDQPPDSVGHGDGVLPHLSATTATKMSSRGGSRSPEQHRALLVSTGASDSTLPPLQGFGDAPHAAAQSPSDQAVAADPSLANQAIPHSPAYIKEEKPSTPLVSSPPEQRRLPAYSGEPDVHAPKQIATLKTENSMRHSSPLRESSVPVPSTELRTPEPSNPNKRPAPNKSKKGTAASAKRAPASKKRKVEQIRPSTPSSRVSKTAGLKSTSAKGTPANSSPAPSARSRSADPDEEVSEEDEDGEEGDFEGDDGIYCLCRKPDTGTFMIGCDGTCDDWFHGKCVGIQERDKNLIDRYMCPDCTKAGVGLTAWKRMCRRSGCRQPARIGKTKNGSKSSKYCSDECGVAFFREMSAKSRGYEAASRQSSNRRRGAAAEQSQRAHDNDLGARGGTLSVGEVKTLIDSAKTAEDFRRLGEGVLSPPATPEHNDHDAGLAGPDAPKTDHFTDAERLALAHFAADKDAARSKHTLLKDRMKFVTMAKQAGARAAAERELKPKDYCGYDPRIQWTDEQFAAWRASPSGHRALDAESLSLPSERDGVNGDDTSQPDQADASEVCDRKKCARHLEWPKLAMDDVRFEMADNSDRMRALDRDERQLRERAALRAKRMADAARWAKEGAVEVHHDLSAPKLVEVEIPASQGQQEQEHHMDVDLAVDESMLDVDSPMVS